jgi:hypothetical protein
MASFSANLGFLWQELPLPDAIRAAKAAGFDAVECHWPYNFDTGAVAAALRETGLTMLGLNTSRGNVESGDNGLAAIPGREDEAQAAIRQAVDYAVAIGALNIHVMAGKAEGEAAHRTFVANLTYACERAAAHGITILIEPLNHRDAPGYFLKTSGQAVAIISQVAATTFRSWKAISASGWKRCSRISAMSRLPPYLTVQNPTTGNWITGISCVCSIRSAMKSRLVPNIARKPRLTPGCPGCLA